jgi:hypothetical protein
LGENPWRGVPLHLYRDVTGAPQQVNARGAWLIVRRRINPVSSDGRVKPGHDGIDA